MPRTIASAMQTSLAAEDGVHIVWLLHFAFSGGDVRLCTAAVDIDWNGFTWEAVGGNISASGIQEDSDTETTGLTVTLPAVDTALTQTLLTENYIGRTAQIWRAHLNDSTGLVVADPINSFVGQMNGGWRIAVDRVQGTASIKGKLSSQVGGKQHRKIIRRNLLSHQDFFTGDKFYEWMPSKKGKKVYWSKGQKIPIGGEIIPQGRGA